MRQKKTCFFFAETSKISLITDIKGIPININLSKGNINDAKIILHQLDNLQNNVNIKNNNNIFIGDAAYDSNNIRNKLNELKLGYLIADKNKRNIFFFIKKTIILKKNNL